jgi:hypothetical protein
MKFYHLSGVNIPNWIVKRTIEWSKIAKERKSVKIKSGKLNLPVYGFDTETIDGYCKLIACSDQSYCEPKTIFDILKFLTKANYRESINLFWNIDYDFFAIIKYLDESLIESVYHYRKVKIGEYQIKWIPRKAFEIRKDKKVWKFFDLWQFYRMSLNEASKKYLGDQKIEVEIDRFDDLRYWEENKEKIIRYCIKDAELTAKLGLLLQEKLNKINVSFEQPYSCGAIAIKHFSQWYQPIPFKPTEWNFYAFLSYFGGRFEITKRGYVPKVYQYDINSAYPYQIANLIDLRYGQWVKSKDVIETAEYGFCKIIIRDMKDTYVEPFCYRSKDGLVFYPKYENVLHFCTLHELLYAEKHYKLDYDIIDGWYFIPEKYVYPFKDIQNIYEERRKIKKVDPVMQLVLKLIMNSLYGKFAERNTISSIAKNPYDYDMSVFNGEDVIKIKKIKKVGKLFNPVYASYITAKTRLQCLDLARKVKKHCVAMFTDCVVTTKKLDLDSTKLGEWSFEMEGEGLFLLCGVYTIRNEEKTKTRLRGIHIKEKIDLFEEIKKNPTAKNLYFVWKKAIKLGETLLHYKKYSIEDLNRFIDYQKFLHVDSERKRTWEWTPETFGELLNDYIESNPLFIR